MQLLQRVPLVKANNLLRVSALILFGEETREQKKQQQRIALANV